MTNQSPWSIKGIKSNNRETVKGKAMRNGLTIGEYINQLIEDAENRNIAPNAPIYSPVFDNNAALNQNFGLGAQAQPYLPPVQENSRLANAVEALNRKLETVAQPDVLRHNQYESLEFNRNTEKVISTLIDKFDDNEHRTNRNLNQLSTTLNEVRQAQETIAERLRRIEAEDPDSRSVHSLRLLEQSLSRLVRQISQTEERTETLARDFEQEKKNRLTPQDVEKILEGSVDNLKGQIDDRFNHLSHRLNSIEDITTQAIEQTDKGIGLLGKRVIDSENKTAQLNDTLKDALIELSARLNEVEAKDISPKIEEKLGEVSGRLDTIEDIATQAIEQTDKGINLLSERIKDTQIQNSNTNETIKEALVDISARLTEVENNDPKLVVTKIVDEKIADVTGRLTSIEDIATQAIEQTDKGINLLSDRIKEGESHHNRTNDTIKEALIDLSARLNLIEENAPIGIKNELDSRFGSVVKRIEEVDNLVERFINNAQKDLDEKFAELTNELDVRLQENEKQTLGAIENIGNQIVKTAEGLDARVRKVEDFNESVKDHGLAMRLELGRISHAIDARLSAIENRDSDIGDRAGEHISHLAEQITNRLNEVEQRSNEFINQIAHENRALLENANRNQSLIENELTRKFSEIDNKISKNLDEKFSNINLEIKAAEDRAKAVSAPLHRSIDEVLERLGQVEARTFAPFSETIMPPNQNFGNGMQELGVLPNQKFNEPSANEAEFIFGESDDIFAPEKPKEDTIEEELTPLEFHEDIGEPIFDFGKEELDNPEHHWDGGISANSGSDYLNDARQAAIRAATIGNSTEKPKKKLKKEKPSKKIEAFATNEPLVDVEPILDGEIKISTKSVNAQKPEIKSGISPLGKIAAGALAVATISTGYIYWQNYNKKDTRAEMPKTLQEQAPPAKIEQVSANAVAPQQSEILGVNQLNTNQINPNSQLNGETAEFNNSATKPAENLIKPANTGKVIDPFKPAPINNQVKEKSLSEAQNMQKAQLATAPVKDISKVTPQNLAAVSTPKIASVNVPNKVVPIPNATKNLYDQAIAKEKSGDKAGAIKLLNSAADSGDTRAQNRLAKMYEKGDGVPKNMALAKKWTERAALAGSKQAQHNLGVYYVEAETGGQDFAKAADNFKKAARRGLTDSQYNLAAMAEQGLGVPKSKAEAYFWYSLAAKNGDSDASRKSKELGQSLDAKEKDALDRKITSFKSEAGGAE